MKQQKLDLISVEDLRLSSPCRDLRSLHYLIKEKFVKTINVAFKPVPTNTDFYYCRNLMADKSEEKQNDSDDEISNHPSVVVEFNVSRQNSANLQRLESTASEIVLTEVNPLFLHLICSIHYNNMVVNSVVKVLPTCLGDVIQSTQLATETLDKTKLRITLDILCLTLPVDVQNVISDFSPKGLRTTSFCSDYQPSAASTASEASFVAE